MFNENFLFAFGLTVFAGLSTGIGSFIAFFSRKRNSKVLALALGFSAGVMIYVSFVEIFSEARKYLVQAAGMKGGSCLAVASFFLGIAIIAIIIKIVARVSS